MHLHLDRASEKSIRMWKKRLKKRQEDWGDGFGQKRIKMWLHSAGSRGGGMCDVYYDRCDK
jgi:hypothetical protein